MLRLQIIGGSEQEGKETNKVCARDSTLPL